MSNEKIVYKDDNMIPYLQRFVNARILTSKNTRKTRDSISRVKHKIFTENFCVTECSTMKK